MIIVRAKNEFFGYWYLYIHSKLKERSINNELRLKEAKSLLFEWRVPKTLRIVILKELENLELVKMIDRNTMEINQNDFNIDNINEIYSSIGLLSLKD